MIHWTIDGKLRKGESCYMNLIGGSKEKQKLCTLPKANCIQSLI